MPVSASIGSLKALESFHSPSRGQGVSSMLAGIKRGVGTVVVGVDVARAVDFITEVELGIVDQRGCTRQWSMVVRLHRHLFHADAGMLPRCKVVVPVIGNLGAMEVTDGSLTSQCVDTSLAKLCRS